MSDAPLSYEQRLTAARRADFFEGLAKLFADYPEVRPMWSIDGLWIRIGDGHDRLVDLVGGNAADIVNNATRISAGLRKLSEPTP